MHEGKARNRSPDCTRTRRLALIHEVAKFGTVGGLGIVVNFAVFNLLRAVTRLPVMPSSIIATSVAILFNYLGFRYFTYRDRSTRGHTSEFTLFVFFSLAGLLIENGTVYVATSWLGWKSGLETNLFKALGITTATCFRFCSYRTWVFRPSTDAADPRVRAQADR